MAQRRKIEVFSAGCPCCTEAVELVEFLAGTEHDIEIRDMHDPAVAEVASGCGIRRVPSPFAGHRGQTNSGPSRLSMA